MHRWWERRNRLEWELDQLTEAGFRFDETGEIPESGPFAIQVYAEIGGEEQALEVIFPDLFPYFRFEVFARSLSLPLHQNPLEKNLCLLGRSTPFLPQRDSLRKFLLERLPTLIEAATTDSPEDAADLEEHQAEPVTDYYGGQGIVLIDGSWHIPGDEPGGNLVLGAEQSGLPGDRVAVLEVHGRRGKVLARLPESVSSLFSRRYRGRWLRRDAHLLEKNPQSYFLQIKEEDRGRRGATNRRQGKEQSFYAVLAPEEVRWRDESGVGWVVVTELREAARPKSRKRKGRGPAAQATYFFLHVGRVGQDDLQVRIPELAPLAKKTIAIVGLGSLGAPAALALAQAGVRRLHLIDHDWVDPGAMVRWPIGLSGAGALKAECLEQVVGRDFPYTAVTAHRHRIGACHNPADLDLLAEIVEASDLLLDATGDFGVEYFLSRMAREAELLFVSVSGTLGGWGGMIYRWTPGGSSGCWWCLQQFQRDGDLPEPPAGEGKVQPAGCGDPTFTGAGFDMHSLALAAVRASVELLSPLYPRADWDTMIISFRDKDGHAAAPEYVPFSVPIHPDCQMCSDLSRSSG